MYNEEQKNRFLSNHTTSAHTAKSASVIFNALAHYEELYDKDLCAMSVEELQPVVNDILGPRSQTKQTALSVLREYVAWCVVNKCPGACDSIKYVDLLGLDKLRRRLVANPLQLQNYFDTVFRDVEEERIDIVYRCWFWMGYGGIGEADALLVEDKDVDLNNLVIRWKDREYPIYKEAVPAFRSAVTLKTFFHDHQHYQSNMERVPGNTILRGVKTNARLSTLRSSISRQLAQAVIEKKTKLRLSYSRAVLSGLLYRIYEKERAGVVAENNVVDFLEIARQQMEGKEYSLSGGGTMNQKLNQRAREIEQDYQRWKLAFSI